MKILVTQMAAFIDQISQDCTSMGVEVRLPWTR